VATGRLIVFEGAEGVGKTTQLKRLSAALSQADVPHLAVREPGQTAIGNEIRRLLLDPASDLVPRAEALLFMASRAQLVERVLRPALERNTIVLLDRFFLATYAYQGAGRGLPDDEIVAANRLATSGLVPDLTILLTLPADEGLRRAASRGGHDRIERADAGCHARVSAAFARFATPEWQARHPDGGPIAVVDARGSEVEVFDRVHHLLRQRWPASFPFSQ